MLYSLLVCILNGYVVAATYSIHYYNQNVAGSDLLNAGKMSFVSSPNPLQVADIFTRISGRGPLLLEEEIIMPSRSMSDTGKLSLPYLVEVKGGGPGVLSSLRAVKPVIKAGVNQQGLVSPLLGHVIQALDENNVHMAEKKDYTSITISNPGNIKNVIDLLEQVSRSGRPVVILHDNSGNIGSNSDIMTRSSDKHMTEDEGESNTNENQGTPVKPLTEFQISQYQIVLWTALIMGLLILSAICSIVQMEVIPDSLLSAKFQSSRTGSKFD